MLSQLISELHKKSSKEIAENSRRFFNQSYTDKNDKFIGLTMSQIRGLAKKYQKISFQDIQKLINSNIHEFRMVGGIILNYKSKEESEKVFEFYLKNTKKFYNWDLVDATCNHIIGKFLLDKKKERKILYELAKSTNLWERRIAIVSTGVFINNNDFGDTLKISEILLKDKHDLINKAVGWMLREIGIRNEKVLIDFLKINYSDISRTTLRYAIEKFPETMRKNFLKGTFD